MSVFLEHALAFWTPLMGHTVVTHHHEWIGTTRLRLCCARGNDAFSYALVNDQLPLSAISTLLRKHADQFSISAGARSCGLAWW